MNRLLYLTVFLIFVSNLFAETNSVECLAAVPKLTFNILIPYV